MRFVGILAKPSRERGRDIAWKLKFALLPTEVGILDNGKKFYVWFEHYEEKLTFHSLTCHTLMRRPLYQMAFTFMYFEETCKIGL